MKYNKPSQGWGYYVEYRGMFRGCHRTKCGTQFVPIRFRNMLGKRIMNTKRRIIDDWKSCYSERREYNDWVRGDE